MPRSVPSSLLIYLFCSTYWETPVFPLIAILSVYIGCVDYLPKPDIDSAKWKLSEVPAVYGPGPVLSWVWTVNCLIYDAYQAKDTSWLDVARIVPTLGYAGFATGDHVIRAWRKDLGPSFAAGRYVSDKAFETMTILYIVQWFRTYLSEGARTTSLPRHRPTQFRTLISPCWILCGIWVAGRLLTLLEETFVHKIGGDSQLPISWEPVIPRKFRGLTFVVGLGFAMLINFRKSQDIQTIFWKALPFGFWLSLAILHSGLYGTISPLRLTTEKFEGPVQVMPVALAVLASLLKYGSDIFDGFCTVGRNLSWFVVHIPWPQAVTTSSPGTSTDQDFQLNDRHSEPVETSSEIQELGSETVRQPEYVSEDDRTLARMSIVTPANNLTVLTMPAPVVQRTSVVLHAER